MPASTTMGLSKYTMCPTASFTAGVSATQTDAVTPSSIRTGIRYTGPANSTQLHESV
jgi:hypothetical protein